jgi:2-oxoglutarate dehydrogenase complex dihydrolipoamide succinyltransferase (E2) component
LSREFKLPDLGEGVAEGEIVKWLVKEGDSISEDQPMVEVMTDKATVQIPSPTKGRVGKILTKEGQTAKVGDILVTLEDVNGSATGPAIAEKSPALSATPASFPPTSAPSRPPGVGIVATPATRKLARDLNINIDDLAGTGPAGRITEDDVRKAASQKGTGTSLEPPKLRQPVIQQQGSTQLQVTSVSTPTVSQMVPQELGGPMEERIPIHGIRKRIADKMSKSLRTTAQVTHVDEVDFTQLVSLREKLKPAAEQHNLKLTFMPFIMHAAAACLKEFPYFNASIDDEKQEIILKHYYNMGFATDTPNGLIVPVIKDLDKKSIFQIAKELGDLSEKARTGKIALDEIQGGTFTVTNVGVLGGIMSTPIINVPEVAILGVQRIQKRPVVKEEQIVIREMSYLSLSFDHRIVDGADAARFTTRLISVLENPGLLMTNGVRLS